MVLYSAGIDINLLSIIVPLVFFGKNLYSWKKNKKLNYMNILTKILSIFWLTLSGIILAFFLLINILATVVPMYAYYSGNYLIVEGKVENYVPMPPGGHSKESFSIKGINFSYSDYSMAMGYKRTQYFGGVIKGNGQNLKIYYIHNEGENYESNSIIRIEEVK